MTYEVKHLGLGGFGVFHGATLLQDFAFEADARRYADHRNAVLAGEAEEAERVYLERRAGLWLITGEPGVGKTWSPDWQQPITLDGEFDPRVVDSLVSLHEPSAAAVRASVERGA